MIVLKPTTHKGRGHLCIASVYGTEGYWFEPSGVYWLLQNNRRRVRKKGKWVLDPDAKGATLGAMDMLQTNRKLISTTEAAGIYGCTTGRIRQIALAGGLWSAHLSPYALVFDADEVKKKAKVKAVTGRPRKYA